MVFHTARLLTLPRDDIPQRIARERLIHGGGGGKGGLKRHPRWGCCFMYTLGGLIYIFGVFVIYSVMCVCM